MKEEWRGYGSSKRKGEDVSNLRRKSDGEDFEGPPKELFYYRPRTDEAKKQLIN